jgi:DNA-binding NarL/FixJ family response regulator
MPARFDPESLASVFSAIVADELPLLSEAIAAMCASFAGCRVLGHCSDGEEAWEMIERLVPDIAVLDLNLSRQFTVELIRRTRALGLVTKVVALSSRADRQTVLDVLRIGAHGYVLKTSEGRHLEEGMRQVMLGGLYLSPNIDLNRGARGNGEPGDPLHALSAREQQVFSLLVDGVRAKEIAARLTLSPKTVDTYRASLMRKLDIHDVAGLVKFAIQHKMMEMDA